LYFNRSKGEKKKLPAIHTDVSGENPDGNTTVSSSKSDYDQDLDTIPKTSLPSSPRCSV
jgi:hypothetical protein